MKKQKRRLRRLELDKQDFKLDELLGLEVPTTIDWTPPEQPGEDYLAAVNEIYDILRERYPEEDADSLMMVAKKYVYIDRMGKYDTEEGDM